MRDVLNLRVNISLEREYIEEKIVRLEVCVFLCVFCVSDGVLERVFVVFDEFFESRKDCQTWSKSLVQHTYADTEAQQRERR